MPSKNTEVVSVRLPSRDVQFLKDLVAQYPMDTLNAMLGRMITDRIAQMRGEKPEF